MGCPEPQLAPVLTKGMLDTRGCSPNLTPSLGEPLSPKSWCLPCVLSQWLVHCSVPLGTSPSHSCPGFRGGGCGTCRGQSQPC